MGEGGGDPPQSEINDIIVLPMATGIYQLYVHKFWPSSMQFGGGGGEVTPQDENFGYYYVTIDYWFTQSTCTQIFAFVVPMVQEL